MIFLSEHEISRVVLQGIHRNNALFPCGDDFDAVLAICCSYDYDANGSKAAGKTAVDEKIIANAPCEL